MGYAPRLHPYHTGERVCGSPSDSAVRIHQPTRFSKEDFRKFRRADAHATKESRVIASVIPIIEGDPGDPRCVASDVPFTNLDHLTDGSLICAKPDHYYGARPDQLHPKVREDLSNVVVPSTQDDLRHRATSLRLGRVVIGSSSASVVRRDLGLPRSP